MCVSACVLQARENVGSHPFLHNSEATFCIKILSQDSLAQKLSALPRLAGQREPGIDLPVSITRCWGYGQRVITGILCEC